MPEMPSAESHRLNVTIAALILLLGLAGAGCGPTISGSSDGSPVAVAPTYHVGETWRLSNGQIARVHRIDSEGGVMFSGGFGYIGGGRRYRWTNGSIEEVGIQGSDITARVFVGLGPGWKVLDFPLEIGKTWHFSGTAFIHGRPHRMNVSCRVWSYEDVNTKAGTFKAFRITIEWNGINPDYQFTNLHIMWYAPAVKFSVKEQSIFNDYELVSYSVR
jgi:hypothetical protein